MRLGPAILLCAASGCAQIFGLDVTSGPPDANVERTSIQMERISVGATVTKTPLDMTGQTGTWFENDGAGGFTKTAGELGPMDTISAPITMGTPPVLFTTPDMQKRFLALPARALKASIVYFEHPNPVPPAATSQITLTATLPSGYVTGESFQLLAVGPWTQRGLMATELPAPDMAMTTISTTIDYSTFTPQFSGGVLSKITAADYVFFLRHQNGEITGVLQAQFDQTDAADPISGTVTAVTADKTLTVGVDPTAYSTRYAAVRPAPTGLTATWLLTAAPGVSVGSTGGVSIKSGGVAATDTQISTMFGNPFESLGWNTILTFITSTGRMTPYMYMGMPVSLGANMVQALEAPTSNMPLTLPAGLPITIRANLTALTTDGMSVTLDLSKPVEIDAIVDKPTATAYKVILYEIQPTGSLEQVVEATFVGNPKVTLPQELFSVGKTYVIRFHVFDGAFPAATSGDVQIVSLPYSYGYLDSGAFTVVAP